MKEREEEKGGGTFGTCLSNMFSVLGPLGSQAEILMGEIEKASPPLVQAT